MTKIPIVAVNMAMVGTIQCIPGALVHPNMNSPIGKHALSTQAKYKRPSGVLASFPCAFASFSW